MGKYQAYSEYLLTGDSDISKIPVGWNYCSLKRYLTVQSGDMLPANKVKEDGIPVVGGNGFRGFTDEFNTLKDTVVIGRVGAKCGCVHTIRQDFWASEHAFKVIPRKKYCLEFMAYCLASLDLNKFAITTAQPLLNTEIVTSKNIAIPRDYAEQQKIANFLDHETAKIDTLIEKQQQLIALLKEKRQAVISHAVTKGLNPNAPMRDSGVEWLGDVPEHWDLPKLIHRTSRIGDGLHSTPKYEDNTGYYFVNGNNLVNGQILVGATAKEVPEKEYKNHYVYLDETSVMLSINGTIGNVARYNGEKIILGKSAAYMNCSGDLLPEYLMLYMQSRQALRYFDLEVTGTTIFNLSLNSIRQMKVCIPPKSEQLEINVYCQNQKDKYDLLIGKASGAITLMQERRTALISAAVTGKIDVRNWALN